MGIREGEEGKRRRRREKGRRRAMVARPEERCFAAATAICIFGKKKNLWPATTATTKD